MKTKVFVLRGVGGWVLKIFRSWFAAKNASERASALAAGEPHIIVCRAKWCQQGSTVKRGTEPHILLYQLSLSRRRSALCSLPREMEHVIVLACVGGIPRLLLVMLV